MDGYFRTRFNFDKKRNVVWKEICKYIQKYISYESSVLDVGTGYGDFINNIKCRERYAIDIEAPALRSSTKKTRIAVGSFQSLPFKNQALDVLFASNVLEHLDYEQMHNAIKESFRVLKKDGLILIISPNFKYCYKEYFDDYTHKSIITDASIKDLLMSVGFEIVKVVPRFLPFSTKRKLPISSFLIRLYLYSFWKPFGAQFFVVAKKG